MYRRKLGATGLEVSEISLGCNRIGAPTQLDGDWLALIRRALELGVNLFDTADMYADGHSEALLGQSLAGQRLAYICTKVGALRRAEPGLGHDLRPQRITSATEASLRRLGCESVDVLLLHSPPLAELERGDAVETVKRLKEQGKVRHWGVSLPESLEEGFWAIEHGAEVIQVEHNLLLPGPQADLYPLARQRGVGVLARIPLGKGLLSGKYSPDGSSPDPPRRGLPQGEALQRELTRVEALRFLERPGQTMAQAGLRYVLSDPAVSCAIPGARTIEQLEANVSASNRTGLSQDELARVREVQRLWRQC